MRNARKREMKRPARAAGNAQKPMFIHKRRRLRCHPSRLFPFPSSRLRVRSRLFSSSYTKVLSSMLLLHRRRRRHHLRLLVVDDHDDDYDDDDDDGNVQQREQNVPTPPTPPSRINLVSLPLSLFLFPRLSLAPSITILLLLPFSLFYTHYRA